jgi:hypothetical protein
MCVPCAYLARNLVGHEQWTFEKFGIHRCRDRLPALFQRSNRTCSVAMLPTSIGPPRRGQPPRPVSAALVRSRPATGYHTPPEPLAVSVFRAACEDCKRIVLSPPRDLSPCPIYKIRRRLSGDRRVPTVSASEPVRTRKSLEPVAAYHGTISASPRLVVRTCQRPWRCK